MIKKLISCFLVAVLISMFVFEGVAEANSVEADLSAQSDKEASYSEYIKSFSSAPKGKNTYFAVLPEGGLNSSEDINTNAKINIEEAGLYNLEVTYTAVKGGNASIERSLLVNGKLLFKELNNISFERSFKNEGEIKSDNLGNDIVPAQIEVYEPLTKRINDISGYYNNPYEFWFEAGETELTFVGIQGNFVISEIKAVASEEIPKYSQVKAEYEKLGYKNAKKDLKLINAENASLKSSYTLVPITDRSSPATVPYSAANIKLNTIGGSSWNVPGMWLEWQIEAEESALYSINFRYRQNYANGVTVFRKLYIDGKIPFSEAAELPFEYDRSWCFNDTEDYLFYLEKGSHTIRLESVLGEMGSVLRQSEEFSYNLNSLYREIIMVTGVAPDIYRDYKIEQRIENLSGRLTALAEESKSIISEIDRISGGKNSVSVLLASFSEQLKRISKDPEKITTLLSDFKNNIISFGETLSEIRETPLELDYILITSPDSKLNKANSGIFAMLKHEITAFVLSFIKDYSSFSNTDTKGEVIEVWMSSGREQANILKNLIDSDFHEDGIAINLKLVQGALLQAMIAGKGPDVALNLPQSDPVNYALRGAVCDLSDFDDFIGVSSWFNPGALTPFSFEKGVYALPETESFYMMFYRKDVMESLGINPPETWEQFYEILPILSKNNMEPGIPSAINTFATLLYQKGGSFYLEDGSLCALNSQISLNAFTQWTDLYTAYRLPITFDFANRFRTGEMPIAIMDYTVFNTLTAFAPELRGYWDFCEIPGIKDPVSGEINRTTVNAVSGTSILKDCSNKEAAWKFVKWWLSEDAQASYAAKVESVLGESARYAVANIGARQKVGWSAKNLKLLNSQAEWVVGIPEIAGGYFTTRHITNALNSVLNKGTVPNRTLSSYVIVINREITAKRKELKLDK